MIMMMMMIRTRPSVLLHQTLDNSIIERRQVQGFTLYPVSDTRPTQIHCIFMVIIKTENAINKNSNGTNLQHGEIGEVEDEAAQRGSSGEGGRQRGKKSKALVDVWATNDVPNVVSMSLAAQGALFRRPGKATTRRPSVCERLQNSGDDTRRGGPSQTLKVAGDSPNVLITPRHDDDDDDDDDGDHGRGRGTMATSATPPPHFFSEARWATVPAERPWH